MLYEFRIYKCVPGKLQLLLARFENVTLHLWRQHGIRPVGFWTTVIGSSNQQLMYLLRWETLAEREKKWALFQNDPKWIAARQESEREGAFVLSVANSILKPTSFSPER
ncbi:NIPSNAP family protein [Mesorhizobium sp. WSM2561]|uniref:NIPSNAP family protein n=1 Tax=Mesorhizobium sp. WSM2561 TaxID=1040985 RepID=UPI000481205E|nr:NIPSNAP family protein [Mesorhizobium sp. WSM2561]